MRQISNADSETIICCAKVLRKFFLYPMTKKEYNALRRFLLVARRLERANAKGKIRPL